MKKRIKLEEKMILQVSKENIETIEGGTLMEAIGDNKYPCRGVLKNVPVSKYTKNQNGRIYPRLIFEIIERKKLAEGNVALMGHPEEGDGTPKDIAGVWHNFRCGESFPICDISLIGDHGSNILELVKAGGKIGVSSCGWGSMLEDGATVDPNDFSLERIGDFVLNPSQEVYASLENTDREPEPEKKDKFIDSEEKNIKIISENFTNKYSEKSSITDNKEDKSNIKENKIKGVKNMADLEKLYEANHANQIKQHIREAREMVDVDKAIKTLSDLTVVDAELRKEVDREIETLQVKLAEQKKNAEKNASDAIETSKKLSESLEIEKKKVVELETKYNRAKSIVDSIGAKEDSDPIKLKEEKTKIEEELKVAKENIKLMSEDIKTASGVFVTNAAKKIGVKNFKDVKQLCEETIKRNKDLKYLYTALKEAEKRIKSLEKIAETYGYIFEQEEVPMKKDDDDEEKLVDDIDKDTKVVPEKGEVVVMPEPGDEIVEEEDDEEKKDDEVEEEIEVGSSEAPKGGEVTSMITPTNEPDTLPEEIETDTDNVPEEGEIVSMDEEDEEDKDDFPVEVSPEEAEKMEQEDSDIIPEKPVEEDEDEKMPWEASDEDGIKAEQEGEGFQGGNDEEKMPWEEDDEVVVPNDDEEIKAEQEEPIEEPKEDEVVEEEEEDPKDKMAAVRAAKEESIAKRREINYFVTREIKKNSALKDVEITLRKSNSLMEAMQKIDKFMSTKKDKPVMVKKSMTESIAKKKVEVKKPEIQKYVFKR